MKTIEQRIVHEIKLKIAGKIQISNNSKRKSDGKGSRNR